MVCIIQEEIGISFLETGFRKIVSICVVLCMVAAIAPSVAFGAATPGDMTITSPKYGEQYSVGEECEYDWNIVSNATWYNCYVKILDGSPSPNNDNENGRMIIDGYNTKSGSTRTWTMQGYTLSAGTTYVRVKAYNSAGSNTSFNIPVSVVQAVVVPTIITATSSPTSGNTDTEFVFTVRTNTAVTKVEYYAGNSTSYFASYTTGYIDSGSTRTWTTHGFKLPAGTEYVRVKAYNSTGASVTDIVPVTVTVASYSITKETPTHGLFSVPTSGISGSTIAISSIVANPGYYIGAVTVRRNDNGATVPVTVVGSLRTFTMPAANVTVSVLFLPLVSGASYTIIAPTVTMYAGQEVAIAGSITVVPTDAATPTFTYSSTKQNIATVNKDGVITAKAPGEADIVVGADNGASSNCRVTVLQVPTTTQPPIETPTPTPLKVGDTFSGEEGQFEYMVTSTNPPRVSIRGSYIDGELIIPGGVKGADGKWYAVTAIQDWGFYGCNLTGDLVIPDGILEIGEYAFAYDWALDGKLFIPRSVGTIGYNAFAYCGFTSMDIAMFELNTVDSEAFASMASIPIHCPRGYRDTYETYGFADVTDDL